jgi:hypothetical protein
VNGTGIIPLAVIVVCDDFIVCRKRHDGVFSDPGKISLDEAKELTFAAIVQGHYVKATEQGAGKTLIEIIGKKELVNYAKAIGWKPG